MSTNLGTLFATLKADSAQFKKNMSDASKSVSSFGESFAAVGAAAGVASLAIGAFAAKAIGAASDVEENMNVLNVAFKENTGSVQAWAKEFGGAAQRSRFGMEQMAGSLGAMLSGMIDNTGQVTKMSVGLSQLAVDLGSFFNVADDDALLSLRSALAGEAEPMKKFGVTMTEAALNAFALSKGITVTTQKMGEQEKVLLRYAFILDKTGQASGDAVKTADSFANSLKGLQAQLQDTTTEMGKEFVPVAAKLVSITKSMLSWFNKLSPITKTAAADFVLITGSLLGMTAATVAAAISFGTLSKAMGAAATPLLVAAAAVGAVTIAFGVMGEHDFLTNISDGIKAMFVTVIQGAAWAAEKVLDVAVAITKMGRTSREFFGVDATGLTESISEMRKMQFSLKQGSTFESLAGMFDVAGPTASERAAAEAAAAKSAQSMADQIDKALSGIGKLGSAAATAAGKMDVMSLDLLDPATGEKFVEGFGSAAYGTPIEEMIAPVDKGLEEFTARMKSLSAVVEDMTPLFTSFGNSMQSLSRSVLGPLGSAFQDLAELVGLTPSTRNISNLNLGIGGAVGVLGRSEVGSAALDRVDMILDNVADMFGEMLRPMIPLLDAMVVFSSTLAPLIQGTVAMLQASLPGLNVAIEGLLGIFRALSLGVAALDWAIKSVVNSMVAAFAGWAEKIPIVGDRMAESLRSLAFEGLPSFGETMDGINEKFDGIGLRTDVLGDGLTNAAAGVDAFTASILNAPSGFKVAAARLDATNVGDPSMSGDGTWSATARAPIMIQVNGDLNLDPDDTGGFIDKIQRWTGETNMASSGTTESSGSRWLTDSSGGKD